MKGTPGEQAFRLMHGTDYAGRNCAGWVAQRKWDGIFALWTGSALLSRNGHRMNAPEWFVAGLGCKPLACELVGSQEGACFASGLRSTKNAGAWRAATLRVFDAPGAAAGLAERASAAWDAARGCLFARPVAVFTVSGRADLRSLLKSALAAGWEGLMIQPPDHKYTPGRTERPAKVKHGSLAILEGTK